jgi:hypothetical protein
MVRQTHHDGINNLLFVLSLSKDLISNSLNFAGSPAISNTELSDCVGKNFYRVNAKPVAKRGRKAAGLDLRQPGCHLF